MGFKDVEMKMNEQKSKFKLSRDFIKKFLVFSLILIVLIVNGFISFMSFGGLDFSRLATSEYWVNYGLLTGSELVILLCFYSFRKIKNLKDTEIEELAKEINKFRDKIYKLNLPKNSAEWLRNFYNPREKLNAFEDKMCALREKINIDEPFEPNKEDTKNYKKYLKLKKQYEINLKKYDFFNKQIELVKRHREKLELAKEIIVLKSDLKGEIDTGKVEKLENEINLIEQELIKNGSKFSQTKIKYEYVYWDTLTANEFETNSSKRAKAQFHEAKLIVNSIKTTIAVGLVVSVFLFSLLPPLFNAFTWDMVLQELLKLIMFAWFGFRGIMLADTNILFHYKNSLNVRKTIYNELNFDLKITNIEIQEK